MTGVRLFLAVPRNRTKSKGHKKEVLTEHEEKLLFCECAEHWNRLHRDIEDSSLEIQKIHLNAFVS